MMKTRWLFGMAAMLLFCGGYAQAQFIFTVDENGNGTILTPSGLIVPNPGVLAPDPGPGGLPLALTYFLPVGGPNVLGDVVLQEVAGGPISDLIRFNENSLVFYSDIAEGADALADTGFPTGRYTNLRTFVEVGPEGNNGFTYTPVPMTLDPGGFPDQPGIFTYVLISDAQAAGVPEPTSLALLGLGGFGLLGYAYRRRMLVK